MSVYDKVVKDLNEKWQDNYAEKLLKVGTFTFYAVGAFAIICLLAYGFNFGPTISKDQSVWGAFGDFMGGVLNPVLGLVTVYLVLVNARLQRQELKNSLTEMKNSNLALEKQNAAIEIESFQSIFFNWMDTYRSVISQITYQSTAAGAPYLGTAALNSLYRASMTGSTMERAFAATNYHSGRFDVSYQASLLADIELPMLEEIITSRWRRTKNEQRNQLAGMLQSIYGLISWIDEKPGHIVPTPKKHEIFRIIKSHLSTAELAIIFYDSYINNNKIHATCKKYDLFSALKSVEDSYLNFMMDRAGLLK